MILAEWWSVGVSGAVRKPLYTKRTTGLLLVGGTGSSTTTYTQWHLPALWSAAACNQQVHCKKNFWMGSSNLLFTTETAYAFRAFLAGISWSVESREMPNIRTTGNWFDERRIMIEMLLRNYFMAVCKGMHCMGMRPSVVCLSALLPTASDSASVRCCLIGWSKKRPLRDITIH